MIETTRTPASSNQLHTPSSHTSTAAKQVAIPLHIREAMAAIGITNPQTIPTKQASAYLTQLKGVPTASSTLEVFRCQSRGPKYKKIGSRVFYTVDWLDEYAQGVEVKIYDPAKN